MYNAKQSSRNLVAAAVRQRQRSRSTALLLRRRRPLSSSASSSSKSSGRSRTHSTRTWTPPPNTTTTATALNNEGIVTPTRQELWRVFVSAAVPMAGFGFMDQSVMLHAGHLIDCTIGVTFGLSTLTAAAFGQICSDASGVLFGGSLERLATYTGLAKPADLTALQRTLPIVKRTKLAGAFCGVVAGCTLGLANLLFLDTDRSSSLKLAATYNTHEGQEFEFRIEASNAVRENASALTVRGPNVDGLLASMTAALAVQGCSLVEMHARSKQNSKDDSTDNEQNYVEDVFYVVRSDTGEPYADEELEELAQSLLEATRTPMNAHAVKRAMTELESNNRYLQARVNTLEQVLQQQQITVVPASATAFQREGEME